MKKVQNEVTKRLGNGSPGSPNRIKIIKHIGTKIGPQSPIQKRGSMDYSNDTMYRINARKQQEANQSPSSPKMMKSLDPIENQAVNHYLNASVGGQPNSNRQSSHVNLKNPAVNMDNAFQTLGPKSMYKLNYNKTANTSKL